MESLVVYSDGGARGNPGIAGAGFVIADKQGGTIYEGAKPLGVTTNNQAEYWALIFALEWLEDNAKKHPELTFKLDSKLIVEQLKGNYKVKNAGLKPMFVRVQELLTKIKPKSHDFVHIPRRQNKKADELANLAMDQQQNEK
ncbi:ribonuclease HI family protein [Candidatus Berkelbacteria bacterium]|nr:ribonuclease HI family protein [Candidatus Berkelbacteria bacterium]